jgi:hypothetical protein
MNNSLCCPHFLACQGQGADVGMGGWYLASSLPHPTYAKEGTWPQGVSSSRHAAGNQAAKLGTGPPQERPAMGTPTPASQKYWEQNCPQEPLMRSAVGAEKDGCCHLQ